MDVVFFIWKNGDWFDIGQRPGTLEVPLAALPSVGDLIQAEAFFPEFLRDSWETKHKIPPFMKVKERIYVSRHELHIKLDGDGDNE